MKTAYTDTDNKIKQCIVGATRQEMAAHALLSQPSFSHRP